MAKLDLGGSTPEDTKSTFDDEVNLELEEAARMSPSTIIPPTKDILENGIFDPAEQESSVKGLSNAELNDPNAIKITIADQATPIVILFGPPACGKTMTLIRLTRYLQKMTNFTVTPIKTFRPSHDTHYQNLCEEYNNLVSSDDAAKSTDPISFLLLKIARLGKPICQILEAPGEYYYNPQKPNQELPRYVSNIINCNNRKIWFFVVEPNWLNHGDRSGYVERIKYLKRKMSSRDRVVFLYNKIDMTDFIINATTINKKEAITDVKNLYPGIFEAFKNQNPITKFWNEYNCDFIPFSTGDFIAKRDGGLAYEEGSDIFPRDLWNKILKYIKG